MIEIVKVENGYILISDDEESWRVEADFEAVIRYLRKEFDVPEMISITYLGSIGCITNPDTINCSGIPFGDSIEGVHALGTIQGESVATISKTA